MLVSKATDQGLCPERVDRRWMEEHETVAALTKHLFHLLGNITYNIVWYRVTVRKSDTEMQTFLFSICIALKKNRPV